MNAETVKEEEYLSIRDLAKNYKMTEISLKKFVEENNIVTEVIKGKNLIHVRSFDRWMASHIKNLPVSDLESIEMDEKKQMIQIHPLLSENRVIFNPPDLTKTHILKRLVTTLWESGVVKQEDLKSILNAVIERERLCSTAIMDGVAIPHPRSSMEEYIKEPVLVLAISKRGIHFESDDGKPTNLFFFICANRTDIHLKVMARLSRLLRSAKFRYELMISEDFDQVLKVFKSWEEKLGE
ncbi:MAG: PTS sugar transporter subunit IIA [Candidatus Aureabacteria bacterium]|nr:PTS sugar transporter subunit IIA [Candidatus Auribacterota bacterium]